jgi:hypothetical protein
MEKAHILKIAVGILIGGAAGALYGYFVRCAGGT